MDSLPAIQDTRLQVRIYHASQDVLDHLHILPTLYWNDDDSRIPLTEEDKKALGDLIAVHEFSQILPHDMDDPRFYQVLMDNCEYRGSSYNDVNGLRNHIDKRDIVKKYMYDERFTLERQGYIDDSFTYERWSIRLENDKLTLFEKRVSEFDGHTHLFTRDISDL